MTDAIPLAILEGARASLGATTVRPQLSGANVRVFRIPFSVTHHTVTTFTMTGAALLPWVFTTADLAASRFTTRIGAMEVEVVHENGQYLAGEDQTGAFGEGDTIEEALDDLESTLRAFRDDLAEHVNVLDPDMAARLIYLATSLPR